MKFKKFLATLLSVAMVLSMLSVGALANENEENGVMPIAETEDTAPVTTSFGDAADSWATTSIERWSATGIVKGDNNGNFNPEAQLSRAELAQIFVNMLGLTEKAENTFADLTGSEWYADAILKCAAAGIMKGDGVNAKAETNISRGETIVMFGRAVGVTPDAEPDLSDFTDADTVADWAAGYLAPLTKMGILSGSGDGTINAIGDIDRASTMSLLDKAIGEYVNAPGEYEVKDANKFVVINVAAKEGEVVISGTAAGVTVSAGTAEGKIVAKDLKADSIKVDGTAALSVEGKSAVGAVVANATGEVAIAKGVTVNTVTANAAGTITNNGTIKNLTANAPAKVDNQGTITKAEVKADGVILDGKKPTDVKVDEEVKNPTNSSGTEIKPTPDRPTGGGSSTPSHDAIENVVVNFLYFKPVDDKIDYAQFESDYKSVMGAAFAEKYPEALAALKALAVEGKVDLDAAKGVFFNLPWAAVKFDTYEALTDVTLTYTKDGVGGTFAKGNGTLVETNKGDKLNSNLAAKTGYMASYVLGDGAIESDASLGLTGTNAIGAYTFTLTGTKANEGTATVSASGNYIGIDIQVKDAVISFRDAGAHEETPDFDYPAAYAAIGASLAQNGTITVSEKKFYALFDENASDADKALAAGLQNSANNKVWIGVSPATPAGATYLKNAYTIASAMASGTRHDLTGGNQANAGKFISYEDIGTYAEAVAALADDGYAIEDAQYQIWYNASDEIISITKMPAFVLKVNDNIKHTVTFKDGDTTLSTATVNNKATATEPTAPTKTDYSFAGWYKENTLTTAWDFETDKVTEDTTIYAKWASAANITAMNQTVYAEAFKNWADHPENVSAFGEYTFTTEADNTVKVTGSANWVSGFTGFSGLEVEQSGHYIAFQFVVPKAVVDSVEDNEVIIIRQRNGEDETEKTKTSLDKVGDVYYYTLLLRVNPSVTEMTYALTMDWDGSETAVATTKYNFNLSEIVLAGQETADALNEHIAPLGADMSYGDTQYTVSWADKTDVYAAINATFNAIWDAKTDDARGAALTAGKAAILTAVKGTAEGRILEVFGAEERPESADSYGTGWNNWNSATADAYRAFVTAIDSAATLETAISAYETAIEIIMANLD